MKWQKWIYSSISSAHFSILLNGSPKGYFKSSRGLRQGDPLSPMLFVIVVEALHALMERANQTGLISGFSVENYNHEVTHLQFADDTIILCDATPVQIDTLKYLLKWFELL